MQPINKIVAVGNPDTEGALAAPAVFAQTPPIQPIGKGNDNISVRDRKKDNVPR